MGGEGRQFVTSLPSRSLPAGGSWYAEVGAGRRRAGCRTRTVPSGKRETAMRRHWAWSLPVVLSVLLLAGPSGAADDPELVAAEKLLKGAGVDTDDLGLIAFFKARTLAEKDQEAIKKLIRALGDDSFDTREKASKDLVKRGRLALPYLKPAAEDSDAEIAKRARECIEEIEGAPHQDLMVAAVRLAEGGRVSLTVAA